MKQNLRKHGPFLYHLYQFLIGLLFWLSFPILLIYVLVTRTHSRGLSERLGLYRLPARVAGKTYRFWIHAASIGEVKAARIIIGSLSRIVPGSQYVVTTMTIHGRDYARSQFSDDIPCILAPLDIPFIVDRVLKQVDPDVYVCLETELWPLLIQKTKRSGAAAVLLNGRISDKSITGYRRLRFLFSPVLKSFDRIGAISSLDRQRFLSLGAESSSVVVTGNVKHDISIPASRKDIVKKYQKLLNLTDSADVFVAGSTHETEEEALLPLFCKHSSEHGQIWLFAPRHLHRLPEIEELLEQHEVGYNRLSECRRGNLRNHSLILVDTMGELADLYSIASFVFIGGSLKNCGGHNVMEAAIWDKAVFFGPNMQDFQEAADELETGRAGFRVTSAADLGRRLAWCLENREEFRNACCRAGDIARRQQGVVKKQSELILHPLRGYAPNTF